MSTTLPNLTGTQKQIDWAEAIRAEKLAGCEKRIASREAGGIDGLGRTIAPKDMGRERAILDALRAQAGAGYWIDRKGFDTNSMFIDGFDLIED